MPKLNIIGGCALILCAVSLSACGSTDYDDLGFAHPHVVDTGNNIQCVPFARKESGVQLYGDAVTWWRQAAGKYEREDTPEPGSVLVLKGYKNDTRGHVAVVKRLVNDREIVVDHANWLNDGELYLDQPVKDVSKDNDWTKVRVWYQPGKQYGARIYAVQGFILPHERYASAHGYGS